jgi:hypothetical protein
MIRQRPHPFTPWSRIAAGAWLAGCLGFALAQAEDARRNAKQSVEWAHYLLRIEADTALAEHVLQELLQKPDNPSTVNGDPVAQARAQCLIGEIKAARGDKTAAVAHFRQALVDSRLPKGERARVISKVMRPHLDRIARLPRPQSWQGRRGAALAPIASI